MYFAGEALNDTDRFLATAAGYRERLIVPFRPSSEPHADGFLVGVWDIVLDQGQRFVRGASSGATEGAAACNRLGRRLGSRAFSTATSSSVVRHIRNARVLERTRQSPSQDVMAFRSYDCAIEIW
jgi:hypothetical protein